jgi:hypothetical protein
LQHLISKATPGTLWTKIANFEYRRASQDKMKKGILQRISKNWEETKMGKILLIGCSFESLSCYQCFLLLAPPPEVKQEPLADYPEPPRVLVDAPLESNKVEATKRQADVKKVQRDSMLLIRKDYSYKYVTSPSAMTPDKLHNNLEISSPSSIASPTVQKREALLKPAAKRSIKSPISILERYDYHKPTVDQGPSKPKLLKIDNNKPSVCAIPTSSSSPAHSHPPKSHQVPVHHSPPSEKKKESKVIVAAAATQEEISPVVKQEVVEVVKSPSVEQQKDAQSTKINNKINIIFQLNDNKSLRKNIILHRRTPKKMVQKITIKETNNNTDEANLVPEKLLCSIDTQTENDNSNVNLTTSNPLNDEATEHLFFDDDVLISLQRTTISFFEYNRLGSLLKKGETDFKLIDRIPRRLHDTLIDSDNKFQCLCYNDQNSLPIYVEMRAKQKELEDPEMCPIAFLYCNVYYIDQRRAKFSSVHLDTVKSVIGEIMYTCLPHSSYFIMAWNEKSPDTKGLDTGIVKYKLTPNLDLAKLASIRQFPKLNYRTKQINCGKGLTFSRLFY